MKRKIIFCIMLLIFGNLWNEIWGLEPWIEELMKNPFWHLSAEEKVEKLLEDELRYDIWWERTSTFNRYREILKYNNPQENIQALLERLEKIDMTPISRKQGAQFIYFENPELRYSTGNDYAFNIFTSILIVFHQQEMLNQDELNKLGTIYQQKIHKYLETYKVVDTEVVLAELRRQIVTGERKWNDPRTLESTRDLYEKYTNLGYKDLRIGR